MHEGHGLKVGVAVNPAPLDSDGNYDAWAMARIYTTSIMIQAGYREGQHFRIDHTPAAAQVAILAHDPQALVRLPDSFVPWKPGDRVVAGYPAGRPTPQMGLQGGAQGRPVGTVGGSGGSVAQVVADLVNSLTWEVGYRSASMFELGKGCAYHGLDYLMSRGVAQARAYLTGMVDEYGLEACLRHFERGWCGATSNLVSEFPATG